MKTELFNDKIYDTLEPEKRIFLANEKLSDGTDSGLAEALDLIINLRYSFRETRGQIEYIDEFMKIWVDIAYYAKDNPSEKKTKKIRDKYLKKFQDSDLVKLRNFGELYQELLYCEFRHLVRVYIYSCNNSKSYNRYFDIIPIKQSKLYNMIEFDIQQIGIKYASRFGLDELLPEMISAVEDELDAFQTMAESKKLY